LPVGNYLLETLGDEVSDPDIHFRKGFPVRIDELYA